MLAWWNVYCNMGKKCDAAKTLGSHWNPVWDIPVSIYIGVRIHLNESSDCCNLGWNFLAVENMCFLMSIFVQGWYSFNTLSTIKFGQISVGLHHASTPYKTQAGILSSHKKLPSLCECVWISPDIVGWDFFVRFFHTSAELSPVNLQSDFAGLDRKDFARSQSTQQEWLTIMSKNSPWNHLRWCKDVSHQKSPHSDCEKALQCRSYVSGNPDICLNWSEHIHIFCEVSPCFPKNLAEIPDFSPNFNSKFPDSLVQTPAKTKRLVGYITPCLPFWLTPGNTVHLSSPANRTKQVII